jgi:hypothetical protein
MIDLGLSICINTVDAFYLNIISILEDFLMRFHLRQLLLMLSISCSMAFAQTNTTDCSAIGTVNIGGDAVINLAGTDVTDFTVVYNGTTFAGLPAGDFTLPNLDGNATTVLIRANGSGPSDDITCTLDFATPSCVATQDPDTTVTPVDIGTVVTLTLETTGAMSATIDGVPMTLVSGTAGTDEMLTFEATTTVITNTTLVATITNPDGETATCTWDIFTNCEEPTIVSVAPIGASGIVISGSFGCVYSVFLTDQRTGDETVFDVEINTPDGGGMGTGTLDIIVPPDTNICVGFQGAPNPGCNFATVPTLGTWGLILFLMLMVAAALHIRRKQLI